MGTISCSEEPVETKNRVYYQVFLRSFVDSDGDRLGDIPGLIAQLDYLEDLGVQGLWLLPVHPSPSYHKYDVSDYQAIDSIYGSMEDFKQLVAEAHQRDMKVLIDMVINHTDDEHFWFQEALKGKENAYRDYYVWQNANAIESEAHLWHEQPADGALQNTTDERFYGFFWKGMPDLNFDNPKVREEVKDIGKYWLEEIGVDGFRLDAALHIYPFYDGNREENYPKTVAWWDEYGAAMRAIDEEVLLIGEVWEGDSIIAPFLSNGLTSAFNFDLANLILQSVQLKSDSFDLVEQMRNKNALYASYHPDFLDATFLSNHDQNRVRSVLGGSWEQSKLAASLLFTLPGTPFIYYGEELGMMGEKPDERIREPFPWGAAGQTAWTDLRYNPFEITPPLVQQVDDPNSMYTHYKNLIEIRRSTPPLMDGILGPWPEGEVPETTIAFVRLLEGYDPIFVAHNLTDTAVKLSLPKGHSFRILFQTGGVSRQQKYSIELPAYGSAVLQ